MNAGRVAIVGAGLAGGRCAEALRAAGHDGDVVLVGDEPHPPYDRPPLSKELLSGAMAPAQLLLRPAPWYGEHGVRRVQARVVAIDRDRGALRLDDDSHVAWDTLVLATGARPRELAVEGARLPGVLVLRRLEDALALRARLGTGQRLAVVGAGLIGLEVAAAAREAGCEVTVIEIGALPMQRAAPPEIGAHCLALHRARGVEFRFGRAVRRIAQRAGALALALDDGSEVAAETVLVGIGVLPNVELAAAAGLAVGDGIEVDAHGRTSDPRVHAIGDCASFEHPGLGRRLRLEQWQHAQNHAVAIARHLAGAAEPYAELPWAWSTQYGQRLQMVGAPLAWDATVWRGDPAAGKALLFCLHEGAVVAVHGLDAAREMRVARRLVEQRVRAGAAALADAAVRLEDLAAQPHTV